MAKDLISALGNAELNALMAVQLSKLNEVSTKINELFKQKNCVDFNNAYKLDEKDVEFIETRDRLLDELENVVDTMNKIRAAQHALKK